MVVLLKNNYPGMEHQHSDIAVPPSFYCRRGVTVQPTGKRLKMESRNLHDQIFKSKEEII